MDWIKETESQFLSAKDLGSGLDDFQGMGLLDKGTLDKEDKQECSVDRSYLYFNGV